MAENVLYKGLAMFIIFAITYIQTGRPDLVQTIKKVCPWVSYCNKRYLDSGWPDVQTSNECSCRVEGKKVIYYLLPSYIIMPNHGLATTNRSNFTDNYHLLQQVTDGQTYKLRSGQHV